MKFKKSERNLKPQQLTTFSRYGACIDTFVRSNYSSLVGGTEGGTSEGGRGGMAGEGREGRGGGVTKEEKWAN